MIKWLTELFTPAPNDWTLIQVMQGEWTVTNRSDFGNYKSIETSVYEFYYSKSRNEYKLEISGYKPREHDTYINAVKRLNELKDGIK